MTRPAPVPGDVRRRLAAAGARRRYALAGDAPVHPAWLPGGVAPILGHALARIAADPAATDDARVLAGVALRGNAGGPPNTAVLPVLADALDESGHPLADAFDWRAADRGVRIDTAVRGWLDRVARPLLGGVHPWTALRHLAARHRHPRLNRQAAVREVRRAVPNATAHDFHHALARLDEARDIADAALSEFPDTQKLLQEVLSGATPHPGRADVQDRFLSALGTPPEYHRYANPNPARLRRDVAARLRYAFGLHTVGRGLAGSAVGRGVSAITSRLAPTAVGQGVGTAVRGIGAAARGVGAAVRGVGAAAGEVAEAGRWLSGVPGRVARAVAGTAAGRVAGSATHWLSTTTVGDVRDAVARGVSAAAARLTARPAGWLAGSAVGRALTALRANVQAARRRTEGVPAPRAPRRTPATPPPKPQVPAPTPAPGVGRKTTPGGPGWELLPDALGNPQGTRYAERDGHVYMTETAGRRLAFPVQVATADAVPPARRKSSQAVPAGAGRSAPTPRSEPILSPDEERTARENIARHVTPAAAGAGPKPPSSPPATPPAGSKPVAEPSVEELLRSPLERPSPAPAPTTRDTPGRRARDASPVRLGAYRAPAGGMVVRGLFYPGGAAVPDLARFEPPPRPAPRSPRGSGGGGGSGAGPALAARLRRLLRRPPR